MSKASRQEIKNNVMNAFQDAEEMGGVENHEEYALLIAEIIAELSNRLQTAIINHTNLESSTTLTLMGNHMNITVKKVKFADHLSQETVAFSCDVLIDGKKAGTASNNGCGGITNVYLNPEYNELHHAKFNKDSGFAMGETMAIYDYVEALAIDDGETKAIKRVLNSFKKKGSTHAIQIGGEFTSFKLPVGKTADDLKKHILEKKGLKERDYIFHTL